MNEENTKYLFETYPELFQDKDDPKKSLMKYGFCCGDGWFNIINQLLHTLKGQVNRWHDVHRIKNDCIEREGKYPEWIDNYFEENPVEPRLEVQQVKEKFGGLRFYCSGNINTYHLIRYAESLSMVTCEECGAPGKLADPHYQWAIVRCNDCLREDNNEVE